MYLNMASEATGPQERTEASCIVCDWVSQVKGETNKQTNWVAISDLNVKWSQNTVKIFPLDMGCKLNRKSCFICFFGTFGSRDNTFPWFSIWRWWPSWILMVKIIPFWAIILNFMVKTVLKYNKYHSIRFETSELGGKYTLFAQALRPISFMKYWNTTVFVSQYSVSSHFGGSHFGFECQDVSEHNKNHSTTCVMPELAGNDTLFAFLSSLHQERSLFLVFNMASAAILGHNCCIWKSRAGPKYNEYHSIRSAKPKLVKNDTFIGLTNPSGSREMTVHVFEYGVGGHYWVAILDLNVKMVLEHGKNLSIGSGIPNLVGKVASFAFLSHLVQEISLLGLMVFNMASAAILGRHFDFESQDRPKI